MMPITAAERRSLLPSIPWSLAAGRVFSFSHCAVPAGSICSHRLGRPNVIPSVAQRSEESLTSRAETPHFARGDNQKALRAAGPPWSVPSGLLPRWRVLRSVVPELVPGSRSGALDHGPGTGLTRLTVPGAESTPDDILALDGVGKSFGGVQAVDNLSFAVARGQIAALIGPNGAGKTTAFNLVSGVLPLDGGDISFEGRSIAGLAPHQIAARGIARTFQNVQVFGNMTVLENVAVGRHRHGKAGLLSAALRLPGARREEREISERARYYLEWVALSRHAGQTAAYLPFGQQRLLEIARALATEPKLLLLDEPAAGLNPAETEQLAALICRIRDAGITVLLVEHDMDLVMGIADKVVVMDYGHQIAEGTPAEVQNDERVIAAYLGEEWSEACPAPDAASRAAD